MAVEVIECEQGSDEWRLARMGIPTASEFHTVMGKNYGGGDPKERRRYMLTLIGERLTGNLSDNFTNRHMDRGKVHEPMARAMYRFLTGEDVRQVGFLRNVTNRGYRIGASPDSLIGDVGMLEIKSKLAHIHLDATLNDKVPTEHYAQCQGQLWVAEREWVDFVSFCPGLDLFVKRIYRDEQYIQYMHSELNMFCEDMDRIELILRAGRITAPVQTSRPRTNPILVKDF